jgi:RND family efflux transporter MFP subunit
MQMPFKPGQRFTRGDVLVAFDCRRYEADLRAAQAEATANDITVVQNRQLLQRGAVGRSELAISEAKLDQSKAAVESLKVRLDQCKIIAPFDGTVAERHVDVYELPQANSPLMKIVKVGSLEVDLIVPSRWLTWLGIGRRFMFAIDETNTSHEAEIVRLGALVDPISRTTKVMGRLIDVPSVVRPGMSGQTTLVAPSK